MAKTKDASKPAKASKGDASLKSVKGSNVTKPSSAPKAQKDTITKTVVDGVKKVGDKVKKTVKAAVESDDDSETSDSSASSEDESESETEEEAPKAKNGKANGTTNGKVNGKAKPAKDESDSDSEEEDSEEDSSESEDEASAAKSGKANGVKVNGAKPAVAKKAESSDDSEDDSEDSEDSDESDEDDKPAKAKAAAKESSDEDSDDDSSEDDEEEEEEEKPQPKKRKAAEEAEMPAKKSKVEDGGAATSANLFVGSLSWNVDETMLRENFESFGNLAGVRVITDRNTGRSKGYGYVEYQDASDAKKAYDAMQGAEIDGRAINLDFAQPKPEGGDRGNQRARDYGDKLSEPSATLFVGNVSFEADPDAVTEAFSPYGTINGVRLPTDPDTGNPKGYGYVEFSSVDEAKAALEALQGYFLAGRAIRLDFSTPRAGGGGGRGGFGGRGRGDFGGGRGRGRGGFGDRGRGGRGGGRGGQRGGRGGFSTNRGGFGDFKGQRQTFD